MRNPSPVRMYWSLMALYSCKQVMSLILLHCNDVVYLLPRRVQDVQQAGLAVYDHLLPVAVLDGGVVLVNKVVLYQLDGQSRLPNTSSYYRRY